MCKLLLVIFLIIACGVVYMLCGCLVESILGNGEDDDWMVALWPFILVLETLVIVLCIIISIVTVIKEIIRSIYKPLYNKYVKRKFYKRVNRITKQLYEKGKIK